MNYNYPVTGGVIVARAKIAHVGCKKFASEPAHAMAITSDRDMPELPISRPAPPRAEDYSVVPGSQGPRRDFRISVGLREGWDAECSTFPRLCGLLAPG